MMPEQYIVFVEVATTGRKTKLWNVRSRRTDGFLGNVKWHPAWRQYVFWPEADTLWSAGCLADVETFLKNANARP